MNLVVLALVLIQGFATDPELGRRLHLNEETFQEYNDNPEKFQANSNFDITKSEFLRRRMEEKEQMPTVDVEYYLYDENPEGKCVDDPEGVGIEDMIWECTDNGVKAIVYEEKWCKGDIVQEFVLTNTPNSGDYGYCEDFDGVKHAIVNIKLTYNIPIVSKENCPPDVCVLMQGETRLYPVHRRKIPEYYARFRGGNSKGQPGAASTESPESADGEVGVGISETIEDLWRNAGQDPEDVYKEAPVIFSKYGLEVEMSDIHEWLQTNYFIAKELLDENAENLKKVIQESTCMVVRAVDQTNACLTLGPGMHSLACFIIGRAANHYFCDPVTDFTQIAESGGIIEEALQEIATNVQKNWKHITDQLKDNLWDLIENTWDRNEANWQGGAILIGGQVSFSVFDFWTGFTVGIDRFYNKGVFWGGGYGFHPTEGDFAGGPFGTVFLGVNNINDLNEHGMSVGVSMEAGEVIIGALDINLEFGCGSWASTKIWGMFNLVLGAKCILYALGLVEDMPECQCNPYGLTPDFLENFKEWTCTYVSTSVTLGLEFGAHAGLGAVVVSASPIKGYGYNILLYESHYDANRMRATQIDKKCKTSNTLGEGRSRIFVNSKNDCKEKCSERDDCVAAEWHKWAKTCHLVKRCEDVQESWHTVVYQSMNMVTQTKQDFEDTCFDTFMKKCGNKYCNIGETCSRRRCIATSSLEVEVGVKNDLDLRVEDSTGHNSISEALTSNLNFILIFGILAGCVVTDAYRRKRPKIDETYGLLTELTEEI